MVARGWQEGKYLEGFQGDTATALPVWGLGVPSFSGISMGVV